MAKYFYHTCPKCGDCLGVVVPEPERSPTEIPVDARCLRCGYRLAWKVIRGMIPARTSSIRTPVLVFAFLLAFTSLSLARDAEYRSVKRVVDGDTIVLETGERVRLIGVDTPETKHPTKPVQYFGKEASAFTTRMCLGTVSDLPNSTNSPLI